MRKKKTLKFLVSAAGFTLLYMSGDIVWRPELYTPNWIAYGILNGVITTLFAYMLYRLMK